MPINHKMPIDYSRIQIALTDHFTPAIISVTEAIKEIRQALESFAEQAAQDEQPGEGVEKSYTKE